MSSSQDHSAEFKQPDFPVIAIGASAGGLEALYEFFSTMPPSTGAAFMVITHHGATGKVKTSALPELLRRKTDMPVTEVEDGMRLEPNCVFTSPPGQHYLALAGDELAILTPPDVHLGTFKEGQYGKTSLYHPIDYLFRQLAFDLKSNAIGVILSGAGSDGSLGAQAIKDENGLVMVQDPATAEFPSMPRTAIDTEVADFTLSPADLAQKLVEFLEQQHFETQSSPIGQIVPTWALRHIFSLLRKKTGHEFYGYKLNTLYRRIGRRMTLHNLENVKDYIRLLETDQAELELLFKELLIRVTSFFRDPPVWEVFRNEVLPALLEQKKEGETVRVWVPACSTGEEAYTIAMLLKELIGENPKGLDIQIFATDLDSAAIDIARKGLYLEGVANDIPEGCLKRYFNHSDGNYEVRKEVRELIVFAPHNLVKDPPFTQIDLISCRNLLIYLKPDMQRQILPMFHFALRSKGILLMGPSESVGQHSDLFKTLDREWKVFEKQANGVVARVPTLPHSIAGSQPTLLSATDGPSASTPSEHNTFTHRVMRLLATRFAPAALITNERGDIYYLHGKTGDFLEPSEGRPRHNVLEMAREGLSLELSFMIRGAISEEGCRKEKVLKVGNRPGNDQTLVSVEKLHSPETLRGLFLITFASVEDAQNRVEPVETSAERAVNAEKPERHISHLENELQRARESYQTLVEELETSNEELKASNEELQSTNEELQSTNEELETAKEETQSLYEELSTVNSELQGKVDTLSQANDDMQNLLNSTTMAILYLDNDLTIKRFTDEACEIFALRQSDQGRPIGDLTSKLDYYDFERDARKVLKTLNRRELRVKTKEGKWYLLKLLPYRTRENVIDGLICTFINIDSLRDVENSEYYYRDIFFSMPGPLAVIDEKGIMKGANERFCELVHHGESEALGKPIADLVGITSEEEGSFEKTFEELLKSDNGMGELVLKHARAATESHEVKLRFKRLGSTAPLLLVALEEDSG